MSDFTHFGRDISYRMDNDIERKLSKFSYTCKTIRRLLKNKTQRETDKSIRSVSYTHLDVYKTQMCMCLFVCIKYSQK